jgi:hypothetical protein
VPRRRNQSTDREREILPTVPPSVRRRRLLPASKLYERIKRFFFFHGWPAVALVERVTGNLSACCPSPHTAPQHKVTYRRKSLKSPRGRFQPLNVTKVPHLFFFLLTFTFTKKGFPAKTGLVAIKQDLWWLGVHQPRWYYKLAISPHG